MSTYVWLFVVFIASAAPAATSDEAIRPFLKQHCYDCHGADVQEAGLRLDKLSGEFGPDADAATWTKVAEAIAHGDMPPEEVTQPNAEDRAKAVNAIAVALRNAAGPRALALRRMNRREYENTLHDLLGIDTPLADLLPEDSSVQGFDNVAGGLSISSVLMRRYLDAADAAFDGVIRRFAPLPIEVRRANAMEDPKNQKVVEKGTRGIIASHGAFVKFNTGWPPAMFSDARPIEDGIYHVRLAVWPHDPGDRTLAVAVYNGSFFSGSETSLVGIYDVTGTPDKPRIIEATVRMRDGAYITVEPLIFPPHTHKSSPPRPGVAIAWVETEGPLDQAWPSKAQNALMGKLPMVKHRPFWMRNRKGIHLHKVSSEQPREDIERILRAFIPKAFRRPVSDDEKQPFIDLALAQLDAGHDFEQALRVGFTAVLCSPKFLLINREPVVDDYTIASRLSYFLWSSLPDETLLELAAAGKLRDPKVLHAQVDRMIDDPRNERFVENFTGQWLNLRLIEDTTPDAKLYPEFDQLLQFSMLGETRSFFRHVLRNDLSVSNFVDSDFALLNERLARHYGIPDITGHEDFRVVKLPDDSIRGGILTHASVLKVTANGTNTSPVLRGVWVLDRVLGQPVPPPPPGVGSVEPDIRGATTIREQLDKHRNLAACARCHRRIDPPGFALECFDPIGGFRDRYRSLGEGDRIPGKHYRAGPAVEMASSLPGGRAFEDFAAFRKLLWDDRETVARCLAEKLLVYGTGRPLTMADRPAVDAVLQQAAAKDYGLRSMIHAVVDSEFFTRP